MSGVDVWKHFVYSRGLAELFLESTGLRLQSRIRSLGEKHTRLLSTVSVDSWGNMFLVMFPAVSVVRCVRLSVVSFG